MLTSYDKSSSRPITAFRKDEQLLLMFDALRGNRESEILDLTAAIEKPGREKEILYRNEGLRSLGQREDNILDMNKMITMQQTLRMVEKVWDTI